MAMPGIRRSDGAEEAAEAPQGEAAFEESARRDSLRTIAPGTVGTRVVIRECGNVSPRGRTTPGR